MVKYWKLLIISLLFIPIIVNAETKYQQVQSILELNGDSKIVFVVDDNVFTFIDILENPTSVQVDIDDGISSSEVDVNNIFVINDSESSISGDTLKVKPLVIGDTSVSCYKNKSCSKGNLYLKDSMFYYQDKEIKIEQLSKGEFSVRSDNSHYLNFTNNEWKIGSKVQGIKIYKEINDTNIEDDNNQEELLTYIDDEILIIGATKKDNEDEKNESYVNLYVHYDFEDVKEYKIYFKYKNSATVDLKIKFIDKYNDELFTSKYDYLFNNDEYLDSSYLITRIYAKQDSNYSNIKNEDLSIRGGLLDNVSGKSDLHIYVSSKYSAEYFVGDELQKELNSIDKYYIDPDSYEVQKGYEEATDYFENSNIVLASNLFVYNMDMSGYESSFYLRENELGLPWYLNGKKVSNPFQVSENALEANNKVFKFISYVEIENPNTYSSFIVILFGLTIICGIIILGRRKLL